MVSGGRKIYILDVYAVYIHWEEFCGWRRKCLISERAHREALRVRLDEACGAQWRGGEISSRTQSVRDGAEVSLRRPTLSQERKRKKKSACSVRNDGVAGAERKEWRDQVAAEGDERRKYHRPDPSAALRRETAATGRKWRHEVAATGKIAGLKTGHYKWRRGKAGAGLLHSKDGEKLQDWEKRECCW